MWQPLTLVSLLIVAPVPNTLDLGRYFTGRFPNQRMMLRLGVGCGNVLTEQCSIVVNSPQKLLYKTKVKLKLVCNFSYNETFFIT